MNCGSKCLTVRTLQCYFCPLSLSGVIWDSHWSLLVLLEWRKHFPKAGYQLSLSGGEEQWPPSTRAVQAVPVSLEIPRPMGTMKFLDWPACCDAFLFSGFTHSPGVCRSGKRVSGTKRFLELDHLLGLGYF